MKNKLLKIHGFRDRSAGANNVDRLDGLIGVEVDEDSMDYGFIHLIRVHFFNRGLIKRLAKAIDQPGVKYILAHSNGLHFTIKALKLLQKKGKLNKDLIVFSVSGCSNSNRKIPPIKKLYNFYSENDNTLKMATYVPLSSWGRFGAKPYSGESTNVEDIKCSHFVDNHSSWFWPEADRIITALINHKIELHNSENSDEN